tara:strand:- start:63 stop:218 length:156 start_codon:yes stop_codon:yes gene_type:complete
MNLKERGITVGDLLIIMIFLISSIFIINKIKEDDKQASLFVSNEFISIQKM